MDLTLKLEILAILAFLQLLYTSFYLTRSDPCSEPMHIIAGSNFRFYAFILLYSLYT
jgi:hypothetical protein